MKKKILSLLLGLLLIVYLSATAFAANRNGVYILDELEYLTETDYRFLQVQASSLSDALDMDILYVLTYDENLEAIAQSLNLGKRTDQIMLIENEHSRKVLLFGSAKVLTEEDTQKLEEAYSIEPTYLAGITAYLTAADELVSEMNASGAFDAYVEESAPVDFVTVEGTPTRVEDLAGLLSSSERAELLLTLDEISQRQQLDVVVVTVDSLHGKSAMEYADDFFDYNGYGYGENHDGILLLVSMEQRDWWISTTGYGITAFTDAGLEYISDQVVPKLSKGQYAKAFEVFGKSCDEFITQARTGEPYDVDHMPRGPFRFGLCLLISLFIGAFTAGCVVWGLQGQLKSVRGQADARNYSLAGRPQLTTNKETYLYSTMSSRPRYKPSESSSGRSHHSSFGGGISGGSTTHRSSSGRSHGGRGGKF